MTADPEPRVAGVDSARTVRRRNRDAAAMTRHDSFDDLDDYREQQAENAYYDKLDALADAEDQRRTDYHRDDCAQDRQELWATPDPLDVEPVRFKLVTVS